LLRKYDIKGYPTIKLFKKGKDFLTYDGARQFEPLKAWVLKKTGPPLVSIKSTQELTELIDRNRQDGTSILVAYFNREDSPNRVLFKQVAEGPLFDDFAFAEIITGNQEVTKELGDNLNKEGVVMVRPFDNERLRSEDFSKIKEWAVSEGYPLVDEIEKTFKRFPKETKQTVGVLFIDKSVARDHPQFVQVSNLAKKLKGKVAFVYAEGEDYRPFAKNLGIDTSKGLPQLALTDVDHALNYPYRGTLQSDEIEKWIHKVQNGSVKPHMKSQAKPLVNDQSVKIVVGDTFNEIVMDESKDVLLEYYATWCGHCKTFSPEYIKLSNKVSHLGNLVIAKIEGDENDTPVKVEGFPTIYFFPSGKKNSPIKYEGPLSAKPVFDFIKKHAVAAKKKAVNHDEL
jgi:protein disulfide isomerase